jgi:hypothetical protein
MIRFKCIYCGQRILAPDNGRGKKGHCPKCKHELRVPMTTKDRPAISADTSEKVQQAKETLALLSIAQDSPDDTAELHGEKPGWFVPTYDELSLFLMAATLILLSFINSQMQKDVIKFLKEWGDLRIYILVAMAIGGMLLSIYNVFTTREKTDGEKWLMLLFAVAANAATGIAAGIYTIKQSSGWLIVFPIWNIVNAALLILMMRLKIINTSCIIDRDATIGQVIVGLIFVFIIFILCNYVFHLYWAITFSICIVYTTSFDRALQNVFPGLNYGENEQATRPYDR